MPNLTYHGLLLTTARLGDQLEAELGLDAHTADRDGTVGVGRVGSQEGTCSRVSFESSTYTTWHTEFAAVSSSSHDKNSLLSNLADDDGDRRLGEAVVVSEGTRDDISTLLVRLQECGEDDVGACTVEASEDLVRAEAGVVSDAQVLGLAAADDTGNVGAMAETVLGVGTRVEVAISRKVVRTDKVPATLELEAGAEAAAKGRVVVLDATVDDGDDDAATVVSLLMGLADVGEQVRVNAGPVGVAIVFLALGELSRRVGSRGRLLGNGHQVDGPQPTNIGDLFKTGKGLVGAVDNVEGDTVEQLRGEVLAGNEVEVAVLDLLVESLSVLERRSVSGSEASSGHGDLQESRHAS
jgi:hypothetical protein